MNAAVFHQAVCEGDATRVKFLINIGQQARVNQVNKQGLTALQQSCKDGKMDVVHVLLNHGANTGLTGKINRTPLHLAAAGGHQEIVELLISCCADFSIKDGDGNLAIDVAKSEGIAELLAKADAEKKSKSLEANKRKNSGEEWGQNLNSLPPGSRNSLVSNSSSDSGVFTDPDSATATTTNPHAETRLQHRRNVSNLNRSSESTTRHLAMGVLNEWEERTHENDFLDAQTTVNPTRSKLRRSNSERLPAHRRKRTLGKLSEELSALNLSRLASQEYIEADEDLTNENVDSFRNELQHCQNTVYSTSDYSSSSEYAIGIQDESRPCEDNQPLTREFFANSERTPRSKLDYTITCVEEKDEGWEDGDEPESPPPTLDRAREDNNRQIRPIACDELELYRRSQRKNMRSARRRTVDVCESSHANILERNAPGVIRENNNNQSWMNAQHRRPSYNEQMTDYLHPDTPYSRREFDPYSDEDPCPNLTRSMSTCSDTEIRKYYRRLEQLSEMNNVSYRPRRYTYDCNPTSVGYRESPSAQFNDNNNNSSHLPGYEESVRRLRGERARRPNSRQISQV